VDPQSLDIFSLPDSPAAEPFQLKTVTTGERYTKYDIVYYQQKPSSSHSSSRSSSNNIAMIMGFLRQGDSSLRVILRPLVFVDTASNKELHLDGQQSELVVSGDLLRGKAVVLSAEKHRSLRFTAAANDPIWVASSALANWRTQPVQSCTPTSQDY